MKINHEKLSKKKNRKTFKLSDSSIVNQPIFCINFIYYKMFMFNLCFVFFSFFSIFYFMSLSVYLSSNKKTLFCSVFFPVYFVPYYEIVLCVCSLRPLQLKFKNQYRIEHVSLKMQWKITTNQHQNQVSQYIIITF